MNNVRILTIPILPMGMINAFLVSTASGHVLVDTGIPGSEDKICAVLTRNGVSIRDIDLIVITHAHADHAGSVARLRERAQAPVVAHAADLPYYRQEKAMTFCPTGWVGRLLKSSGRLGRGYEAFEPDILLQGRESLNLSQYGLHGAVFSTPGHTEGSLSVSVSERDLLAGDLVSSGILLGGIVRTDVAKPPPFEEDASAVARELLALLDRGFQTFYLGHGGPLPAEEIRRYANENRTSSMAR